MWGKYMFSVLPEEKTEECNGWEEVEKMHRNRGSFVTATCSRSLFCL